MFKKVAPYIGEYKKYTVWAVGMMSVGIEHEHPTATRDGEESAFRNKDCLFRFT